MMMFSYSDPIKAAWQAREHGFRFVSKFCAGDISKALDAEITLPIILVNAGMPQNIVEQKYVIHPDSLALLEPQEGDLVTNTHKGNKGRECSGIISQISNGSATITTAERHNGKRYFVESVGGLQIIQRNSKAFFAPEVA